MVVHPTDSVWASGRPQLAKMGKRSYSMKNMTADSTPDVRPVLGADVPHVAGVMARAFEDDPLMTWIFPDDAARRKRLPSLFAMLLRRQHLRHPGTRLCSGPEGVRGAALWDPPGAWKPTMWGDLLGLPEDIRVFGRRFNVAGRVLDTLHEKHPGEPHWYLAALGTEPRAQRQGTGGLLLRERLDRCDEVGAPAYLESTKPTNVPYYEHFGFQVTGEIVMSRGGPTTWAMWRDAGAG